MRVALRRPSTFRIKMVWGAGGLGLAIWLLMAWNGPPNQAGALLFRFLAAVGFAGCVGAGVFLAADSVSREKREGTLGFLFLTDLRAHDVLFGKLAACSLVPACALVAIFPSLALSYLVGGVNLGEFWRMILAQINSLFFALAVTTLGSTLCFRQRSAYLCAMVLLLAAGVGLPFGLGRALAFAGFKSPFGGPFDAFVASYAGVYGAWPARFWGSLLFSHAAAWTSLLGAAVLLGRCWRRLEDFSGNKGNKGAFSAARGFSFRRTPSGGGPVGVAEPLEWLSDRQGAPSAAYWLAPAASLAAFWILTGAPTPQLAAILALVGIHALFKAGLGAGAAGFFLAQKNAGSFELLLGTPLTVREITLGRLKSFRRQFAKPVSVLVGIDVFLAAVFAVRGDNAESILLGANAAFLCLDIFVAFWAGSWQGLKNQTLPWAIVHTAFQMLVLPTLLIGAGLVLFSKGSVAERVALAALIYGANNALLLVLCRDKVERYFRELALRQFGEKLPTIESDWSAMNWEEEENRAAAVPAEFGA